MDEYAKKLVHTNNKDMSNEELKRITRLVAYTKRFAELISLLPEAEDEFRNNPGIFLEKYGLSELNKDELAMCFLPENEYRLKEIAKLPIDEQLDIIPEGYFRYRQFLNNKILSMNYLTTKGMVPANEKMRKWRNRMLNRCYGDIGGLNKSFVHAPICYEMAVGCSVNCEFCALNAEKLQEIFRHTEENAKLFKEIIKIAHEVLGDAAGRGVMYFATDPLDNPDYEQFEDDYYNEFHMVPQITTAAPARNIERMKKLIKSLEKRGGAIHRFTILSVDIARQIFEEFKPEELLLVELLPQFKEAPAFAGYATAGRSGDLNESTKVTYEAASKSAPERYDAGTIVCIDGFCVNLPQKKITLFTPCKADKNYPKGISELPPVYFENAEDFREKLLWMIDEYMIQAVPKDECLKLYDYFELLDTKEYGVILFSQNGGEIVKLNKLPKKSVFKTVEMLQEGIYNIYDIVTAVTDETEEKSENVFWLINQLWNNGTIVDKFFFGGNK